jgi:ATP-dependent RNA helicase SUPV3L1/SUV3
MNFDLPTLDQMTGGIFGAITSSERTVRVRDWLATEPSAELMQAVYKELSSRDKGACRPLREKLDDLKRAKNQDGLAQEWADKAQALLDMPRMNLADGMAWQRDAAKAGAPLSKEPLVGLKQKLAERVGKIEDLQHQMAVQREGSALFSQRLETLSTKPLGEVLAQKDTLIRDHDEWLAKSKSFAELPEWHDVDAKLPPQLHAAQAQLTAIWGAFVAVLDTATAALTDGDAQLPSIPVWADEIRAQRGSALPVAKSAETTAKPKIDPEQRKAAHDLVIPILQKLEEELQAGHGKASAGAASNLRQVLKENGAWIDGRLDLACHAALSAAGELEGWQRWRADQLRHNLVDQAQVLMTKPLGGRKQQDAIRTLRDQWKLADQGGIPNQGLWKRFDDACNTAYKVVEVWLEEIKAKSAVVIAQRNDLLEELKNWGAEQALKIESLTADAKPDWKNMHRSLYQFGDRWREAGHLGERDYDALQKAWKAAIKLAAAPLDAAQKGTFARRQALIEQAKTMADAVGQGADLRIDFVRELQQQWQIEAQSVPLDRKLEQKQWDTFKATIDSAFSKKDEARKNAQAAYVATLSAHDKAVLEASKALDEANASGEAAKIQAAINALQAALRGQAIEQTQAPIPPTSTPTTPATASTEAATDTAIAPAESAAPTADGTDVAEVVAVAEVIVAPAPSKIAKPLIAMRSDDRKSAKAPETSKFGKKPGFDGRDARPPREEREPRGPRLSDEAFHAQRKAMEQAEFALKKLQMQAHGEVVSGILSAWKDRQADALPTVQALGKAMNAATRTVWIKALSQDGTASSTVAAASTALLRLEMATGAPTPAENLNEKRALQLLLLTKRNDPAPAQTWGADVATVLASTYSDAAAKRLQASLKAALK